jgi:hypothetical protein
MQSDSIEAGLRYRGKLEAQRQAGSIEAGQWFSRQAIRRPLTVLAGQKKKLRNLAGELQCLSSRSRRKTVKCGGKRGESHRGNGDTTRCHKGAS